MSDSKNNSKEVVKNQKGYTDEEQAMIDHLRDRLSSKPLKFRANDKTKLLEPEGDPLLAVPKMLAAFGTTDLELYKFLLDQVVQTFRTFQTSEGVCESSKMAEFCNHAMAILHGIRPMDEIEGLLAVQMIGVHNMAMNAMRLAMISGQYPDSIERNTNRATKLLRTFAAQMEALKKYRSGGQQKMIVEHVHVNKGGQAIVGSITKEGGHEEKK
ncbi:MAG: hypothetical protein JSV31_13845 [Desulfobacterales bacterium]|nr:MAG: hypothetical protein JSV31_13845 [Desulfobacterales bacterium]